MASVCVRVIAIPLSLQFANIKLMHRKALIEAKNISKYTLLFAEICIIASYSCLIFRVSTTLSLAYDNIL
jgi:hypothetical protein